MGSLEHVVDVNLVMKKCANAMKKNGILVLEARGDPLGFSKDFLTKSSQIFLWKHNGINND